MTANGYSRSEQASRANLVVTAGMIALAILGIATVFHEPIAAIFGAPAATGEGLPPLLDEHAAAPILAPRGR